VGPELIGSRCGVGWSAKASAIPWLPMIGGNIGNVIQSGAGIAGLGEEMGQLHLLGCEVVKVDTCAGQGFYRGGA
jgi:hypothetical protein